MQPLYFSRMKTGIQLWTRQKNKNEASLRRTLVQQPFYSAQGFANVYKLFLYVFNSLAIVMFLTVMCCNNKPNVSTFKPYAE